MISEICTKAYQNKNVTMLISAFIYILALFGTLNENIFTFSCIMTVLFVIAIIRKYFPLKIILIWVLLFYFGVINTSLRIKDVDELLNLAPVNSKITGTIISIPQGKTEEKIKFFIKVENIRFGSITKIFNNEKALVTVNKTEENSKFIDNLKIYSKFEFIGRLSSPFKAGNPSQFDYGNYLRNHNAYAVFYAKDFKKIDSKPTIKEAFLYEVNNYRETVIKTHSKYLKSPNLEILGGIVFGDDAVSPPKDIKQSFINSGLLHILAASGMNVAFIYSFFFIFMSLFRINFKIRVILGMIMVTIYSLMTGLGASVIRATCMLLFVLAGKLIDRDAHNISLLSFVALLMLIYNPLFINDVGFQLSFIVTFGILIMAPAITRFKNKLTDFLTSAVTIPIIAQLWVIPIQIFYFNNVSLYSVFANIMSVPILMIISFGGFVSSLLCTLRPFSEFICKCFDFVLNPLITLLVKISNFCGSLPNASIQTTHPNIFQILIYYSILLAFSILLYKDLRDKYWKQIIRLISVLFLILLATLLPIKNSNLEITTFDVGNADCFLIKTPENKYIMVDTGKSGYNGGKSQAEIIILKYLKDRGIKNIESIIISHFDNDHCGGTVDLLNELKVKNIYVNDINHPSITAKDIYKTSKKNSTKITLAQNNQVLYNNKGCKLTNYKLYNGKLDNDNSIITLLEYEGFKMLFTGDAGIEGIKSVIDFLPKDITVLKVPHHGAIGGLNKDIIKYLSPKYSIISTGENKFGHPAMYIIELLKDSTILRTDINNSIRINVSKNNFKVYTFDLKKKKYAEFLTKF